MVDLAGLVVSSAGQIFKYHCWKSTLPLVAVLAYFIVNVCELRDS
jgi:hypothetical protein